MNFHNQIHITLHVYSTWIGTLDPLLPYIVRFKCYSLFQKIDLRMPRLISVHGFPKERGDGARGCHCQDRANAISRWNLKGRISLICLD